jgi:hypothetical protein
VYGTRRRDFSTPDTAETSLEDAGRGLTGPTQPVPTHRSVPDGAGLPPVDPDIFVRSAARCAAAAARGGASVDAVEAIVARGSAQAAKLMSEVR